MSASNVLGVAVVGAGYRGLDLVRYFAAADDWDRVAACGLDVERAQRDLSVEHRPYRAASAAGPTQVMS